MSRKEVILSSLFLMSFVSFLLGHVVLEKDPSWEALATGDLPSLETAQQQYAYALGFDYGQRFRSVNNSANLPLEAFIKGLTAAANDESTEIDTETLRKALFVIQTHVHTEGSNQDLQSSPHQHP